MRTSCVKNGLVMVVIFLFFGVAVQPSIADVSIESDKSEMVEITVEICNVNGAQENTLMLTPEQAKELENLINNFEIELDGTNSIVETETIFKDTVVSLNELGLLPEGISVEEAQRMVTGEEQNPIIVKFLERCYSKNQKSLDNNDNTFCLIAGNTDNTHFQAPIGLILWSILDLELLPEFFLYPIFFFLMFVPHIWDIKPLAFGYQIGLGTWYQIPMWDPFYSPADGWVNTIGSFGIKKWSGSFYGQLPFPQFSRFLGWAVECYPGVLGFTGIKIGLLSLHFYFGFALRVKIGKEHP